jgi:hypothetical protein
MSSAGETFPNPLDTSDRLIVVTDDSRHQRTVPWRKRRGPKANLASGRFQSARRRSKCPAEARQLGTQSREAHAANSRSCSVQTAERRIIATSRRGGCGGALEVGQLGTRTWCAAISRSRSLSRHRQQAAEEPVGSLSGRCVGRRCLFPAGARHELMVRPDVARSRSR